MGRNRSSGCLINAICIVLVIGLIGLALGVKVLKLMALLKYLFG